MYTCIDVKIRSYRDNAYVNTSMHIYGVDPHYTTFCTVLRHL